jgi:DNA-binding FadR family transcriptional regulator
MTSSMLKGIGVRTRATGLQSDSIPRRADLEHLAEAARRPPQSDREHRRVLELIIAKDGDSAEQVMREHVRASRRALMAGLESSL